MKTRGGRYEQNDQSHYVVVYIMSKLVIGLAHLTWSLAGPKPSWISKKPVTSSCHFKVVILVFACCIPYIVLYTIIVFIQIMNDLLYYIFSSNFN